MTDTRLMGALRLLAEIDGDLLELCDALRCGRYFAHGVERDSVQMLRVKVQAAARLFSRENEMRAVEGVEA